MSARYLVTYYGTWNLHNCYFDGPNAHVRAVNYARERGESATVTDLQTGEEIPWRSAVSTQQKGEHNGSD